MTNKLTPIEQKQVLFYDDEITAVRLKDGRVFIPVRPLIERLGVDWNGQRRRLNRDAVLKDEVTSVDVTSTQGDHQQRRAMLCLPLDYISGFLFGINAERVKSELREAVIRYQRECYKVLAEAFEEGRLTTDPTFSELLESESPAAQAYKIAKAMMELARNQLLLESRIDQHDLRFNNYEKRLEGVEAILGDPGRNITPEQASQISQAVKAVALVLSKTSGSNQYGAVYGELYRKFGITSYKLLPANKFKDAMSWITEWHQSLTGDSPF